MTRQELYDELYKLVGNHAQVAMIFKLFSKLTPEAGRSNIISAKQATVPKYDAKKVTKPKPKVKFTPEQQAQARDILRKMGLI